MTSAKGSFARCPICNKSFSKDDPNAAVPFCSERCRRVDAKRWFCEEYPIFTPNVDQVELDVAEGRFLDDDDRGLGDEDSR